MTSTPNDQATTAVRVAGFLVLLAGIAVLLVLSAAAAHAALSVSPPKAEQVSMHRAGAAPHLRHQPSGLRKDDGRLSRPAHAQRVVTDCRSGQHRPVHSRSKSYLATLRWNHKTVQRAQGVHHAHAQGHAPLGWLL